MQLIAKEFFCARSPSSLQECSFFTSLVCHEAGIRNTEHICLNLCWSRPFWSGITKYKYCKFLTFLFCNSTAKRTTSTHVETDVSMFHIPASWQTRDAKNDILLGIGRDILPKKFFHYELHCRYQDNKKFRNRNFEISI